MKLEVMADILLTNEASYTMNAGHDLKVSF